MLILEFPKELFINSEINVFITTCWDWLYTYFFTFAKLQTLKIINYTPQNKFCTTCSKYSLFLK